MIAPILAIVAAWLALSLLTALKADLSLSEIGGDVRWWWGRYRTWPTIRGALLLWALVFVVVGGIAFGVVGLLRGGW